MYPIKQSTSLPWMIFCHDSAGDPVLGLLTGDFTKRISKNGGAFADMTVTITEAEAGWYSLTLSTSHTDTTGILTIYFTHASMEQCNCQFRVEARILDNLAYPAVSGRPMDLNTAGEIGVDFDNTSGTLAKGTDITGFNDLDSTAVAAIMATFAASLALTAYDPPTNAEMETLVQAHSASLALTAYDPPTKAEVDTAVAAQGASLALAVYDPPTKTEMDAGFAALNDIAAADVWAVVIDGALGADDVMMRMNAYISGVVTKDSTSFTYYSIASTTLWTNDINAAWRRPA